MIVVAVYVIMLLVLFAAGLTGWLTVERRLKHPAVVAISKSARGHLFPSE